MIKFLLRLKVINQINIVAVELSTQTSWDEDWSWISVSPCRHMMSLYNPYVTAAESIQWTCSWALSLSSCLWLTCCCRFSPDSSAALTHFCSLIWHQSRLLVNLIDSRSISIFTSTGNSVGVINRHDWPLKLSFKTNTWRHSNAPIKCL